MSQIPRALGLSCLAVALVALALGVWAYQTHLDAWHERKLVAEVEAAGAELDAADPGWRLEQILAALPHFPDDENSAPRIVAIAEALPRGWPGVEAWELQWLAPNLALDARRLAILDKALDPVAAPLADARDLIRYPRGRHGHAIPTSPLSAAVPGATAALRVADLLRLDAEALAQRGDVAGALRSARACLDVARSLDGCPFLDGAASRAQVVSEALEAVQKALALGEASDADLAALQAALAPEIGDGRLADLHRGLRAVGHEAASRLADGRLSAKSLLDYSRGGACRREAALRMHPAMMRAATRLVAAGRGPLHHGIAAEKEAAEEAAALGAFEGGRLFPEPDKVGTPARALVARARALHALAGCERHRLKHGDFPDGLADLVPVHLPAVPLDPFTGEAMRYARWAGGVIVYSVGPDGKDDGGTVLWPGGDVGHRLWDKARRRGAAPAMLGTPR